jgi:hypothetical protein
MGAGKTQPNFRLVSNMFPYGLFTISDGSMLNKIISMYFIKKCNYRMIPVISKSIKKDRKTSNFR